MDRNRLCTVIVRQAIASIAIEVLQSFIRSLRTDPPYLHVFSINYVKEHGSQRAYACNDFKRRPMETPLTPLEFARRARKLYPDRVAVIDGTAPWTYAQFLDRCDRWSAVLQKLGIKSGDRVAYLSPNTHAQLESFYAVPQIGAVLVPLNYRLTADDFVYLINHSGSRMVCADRDYLGTIDSIREQLPKVKHFVALSCSVGLPAREGFRSPQPNSGWLNYKALLDASPAEFRRSEIHETDLLTINYTSGTTSRPKGVMITHRNAWMNSIGTLLYAPMTCSDRYLWTLPMFHANGS